MSERTVNEVLSVRKYRAGYEVREELVDGEQYDCRDFKMKIAYTPEGLYIGDSRTAYRLCKKRGIKPELAQPGNNVCSIGLCEKEQKWYGWSHRAIFGFGIGSTCKKGDCHYKPGNFDELKDDCSDSRDEDCIARVTVAILPVDPEEPEGTQRVVEGSETGLCKCLLENCVYELGRGEWIARTLEDAKQMAIDFANGVG